MSLYFRPKLMTSRRTSLLNGLCLSKKLLMMKHKCGTIMVSKEVLLTKPILSIDLMTGMDIFTWPISSAKLENQKVSQPLLENGTTTMTAL